MRGKRIRFGSAAGPTRRDPASGLAAVRSLRVLTERLESLHVDGARALGWSWQDIAEALGVSKQAVHKKHAGRGLLRKRQG